MTHLSFLLAIIDAGDGVYFGVKTYGDLFFLTVSC